MRELVTTFNSYESIKDISDYPSNVLDIIDLRAVDRQSTGYQNLCPILYIIQLRERHVRVLRTPLYPALTFSK